VHVVIHYGHYGNTQTAECVIETLTDIKFERSAASDCVLEEHLEIEV
jgi:hypothetical protein